ncbi:MAG: hypothetical protein ACYC48_00225 [Minisyncoccota bacterium]
MSFLEEIFHKKTKSVASVILIDIRVDSVAGAYARYEEKDLPTVLYTRRLPIEIRKDETPDRAMLRALQLLGVDLIREGAPVLARATGSGSADMILVSVDAPWQETTVRTENFESEEPFVFTKSLVEKRLKEGIVALPEKMLADESIIGTILNGYETRAPYGRSVHRASIIVLTSLIERSVAHEIISALEHLYHTKAILPISGSSLRYQTIRNTFPHEQDAIILDAISKSLTSIALVRKGVFVSMAQAAISGSGDTDTAWIATITNELAAIAKQYPLPRTIFLLAQESDIHSLQSLLAATNFGSLWLSDNPPKIVAILQSHLSSMTHYTAANPLDLGLLFMTLYYQNRLQTGQETL